MSTQNRGANDIHVKTGISGERQATDWRRVSKLRGGDLTLACGEQIVGNLEFSGYSSVTWRLRFSSNI